MISQKHQAHWASRAGASSYPVRLHMHGILGTLGWLARAVVAMYRTDQQRRALAELDEHLLADIGVDRGTARVEAARAPWDPLPPR